MKLKKGLFLIIAPVIIILILLIIKSLDKDSFELSAKDVHQISLEQKHILSVEDYKHKKYSKENFVLIDLRSKGEYESEHLDGAINIEPVALFKNADIEQNKSGVYYVFYSENLAKTTKTWTILSQIGYNNIYILDVPGELITEDLFVKDSLPLGNEVLKYKFQPDTLIRPEINN
ncbi:MAG: rhodanese-like domain-containing protein [Bacteroidales bacterium]|nr:rhodanese-like domain-containing protein [Bacteroidales bacterium]